MISFVTDCLAGACCVALIAASANAQHIAGTQAADSEIVRSTLFRAGDGYTSYRIPSVIVTTKGTVLAFCEGRAKPSDTGDIDLLVRRSPDGGATFGSQQIVWSDEENTCGNPCPVVDEATGVIWLLMTHNLGVDTEKAITAGTAQGTRTVWITSSDDDGLTWRTPSEITPDVKKPDWAWYATGPGIGIQLERSKLAGRLVIPCDYVRVGGGKNAGNAHVIYSDDHGKSWHIGGEAPERAFNESQIVELSDGRVMLNMRNYRAPGAEPQRQRGVAISDDGGETFKTCFRDETLIEPICQASILRYSWPGDAPGVLLFSNPASESDRARMTVRLSCDDGKSWSAGRVIHAGGSAYSCLVRLADGSVGLLYEAWEDQRYERIEFARFQISALQAGIQTQNAREP
jgi:sialidase-1